MKVLESNKIGINPMINTIEQSISTKNIAKATYILRDKIYSDKKKAAFCETLCNAYDEHVKYNIKKPVDIIITDTELCIRDYALGLSEDKVLNVFFQYFESTKDKDNDFIGGFGIGAKAPGAYSDTYYIESFYNGKKTIYASVVDGFTSKVLKLYTEDVHKDNTGICVRIPIKNSIDKFDFQKLAYDMVKMIGFNRPSKDNINLYIINKSLDYNEWCKLSGADQVLYYVNFHNFNNEHLRYYFDNYADKESEVYLITDQYNYNYNSINFDSDFFKLNRYHNSHNNLLLYDGDMLYKTGMSAWDIIEKFNIKINKNEKITSKINAQIFIIMFKRGELPISPSREQIEMTDAVQKWIYEKIKLYFLNSRKKLINKIKECYSNNIPINVIINIVSKSLYYRYVESNSPIFESNITKFKLDQLDLLYKNIERKTIKSVSLSYFNHIEKRLWPIICHTDNKSIPTLYNTYQNYFFDNFNNYAEYADKEGSVIRCNLSIEENKKLYDELEKGNIYVLIFGEKLILHKNIDYIDFSFFDKKYLYKSVRKYKCDSSSKSTVKRSTKNRLIDSITGEEIDKSEYENTLVVSNIVDVNTSQYFNDIFKMDFIASYDIDFLNNMNTIFGIKHIVKCSNSLFSYYQQSNKVHTFSKNHTLKQILKILVNNNIFPLDNITYMYINILLGTNFNNCIRPIILNDNKTNDSIKIVNNDCYHNRSNCIIKLKNNFEVSYQDLVYLYGKRFGCIKIIDFDLVNKYIQEYIISKIKKLSNDELKIFYTLQMFLNKLGTLDTFYNFDIIQDQIIKEYKKNNNDIIKNISKTILNITELKNKFNELIEDDKIYSHIY